MKEINKIILKEKQKNKPNKDYIQWLQQLSDQNLTANFIYEVKQKKFLEDLYKQNTIELDHYFKYSGKVEELKEGAYKEYQKWIEENPKVDAMKEHMDKTYFKRKLNINQ